MTGKFPVRALPRTTKGSDSHGNHQIRHPLQALREAPAFPPLLLVYQAKAPGLPFVAAYGAQIRPSNAKHTLVPLHEPACSPAAPQGLQQGVPALGQEWFPRG